jgi:hypothetical protein
MTEEQTQLRQSGRYRLNEEDKAKPVPLKLHSEHLEKLEFVPGENSAQKIRYLLDNFIPMESRERAQANEIKRRIRPLHKLVLRLHEPEVKEGSSEKYSKLESDFFELCSGFETLLNLFKFSITDLGKYLDKEDMGQLDIIFYARSGLRGSNGN